MKINYKSNHLNALKNDIKFIEKSEDMEKMQQDAVNRVREMQKRAKRTLEVSSIHNSNPVQPEIAKEQFKNQDVSNNNALKNNTIQNNKFNILNFLTEDIEKSLILCIILVLLEETIDPFLILALLYTIL